MRMYAEEYMKRCEEVLARIQKEQTGNIVKAAEWIADSIANGGVLHFASFMHMPNEPISRAGGVFLIRPIMRYDRAVGRHAPPPGRERLEADKLAEQELESSRVKEGDAVIIVNNAGQAEHIVAVALAAKKLGAKVVAITCLEYSRAVKPRHPSGKMLFEAADLVIDNCGVVGDALVEVSGIEVRACPSSGVTEAYIVWALTAELLGQLVKRGLRPHVYMSANLEGASEFNERAAEEFQRTGV